MSNDMPDVGYCCKRLDIDGNHDGGYLFGEVETYGDTKYYSESHVQQLIQDAISEAKREATKGYVTKVAYDALKNNLEQLIKEAEERANNAERIVNEIWDMFYGQNMSIVGWHLNGDHIKIDKFFEDNDWAILNAGGE